MNMLVQDIFWLNALLSKALVSADDGIMAHMVDRVLYFVVMSKAAKVIIFVCDGLKLMFLVFLTIKRQTSLSLRNF